MASRGLLFLVFVGLVVILSHTVSQVNGARSLQSSSKKDKTDNDSKAEKESSATKPKHESSSSKSKRGGSSSKSGGSSSKSGGSSRSKKSKDAALDQEEPPKSPAVSRAQNDVPLSFVASMAEKWSDMFHVALPHGHNLAQPAAPQGAPVEQGDPAPQGSVPINDITAPSSIVTPGTDAPVPATSPGDGATDDTAPQTPAAGLSEPFASVSDQSEDTIIQSASGGLAWRAGRAAEGRRRGKGQQGGTTSPQPSEAGSVSAEAAPVTEGSDGATSGTRKRRRSKSGNGAETSITAVEDSMAPGTPVAGSGGLAVPPDASTGTGAVMAEGPAPSDSPRGVESWLSMLGRTNLSPQTAPAAAPVPAPAGSIMDGDGNMHPPQDGQGGAPVGAPRARMAWPATRERRERKRKAAAAEAAAAAKAAASAAGADASLGALDALAGQGSGSGMLLASHEESAAVRAEDLEGGPAQAGADDGGDAPVSPAVVDEDPYGGEDSETAREGGDSRGGSLGPAATLVSVSPAEAGVEAARDAPDAETRLGHDDVDASIAQYWGKSASPNRRRSQGPSKPGVNIHLSWLEQAGDGSPAAPAQPQYNRLEALRKKLGINHPHAGVLPVGPPGGEPTASGSSRRKKAKDVVPEGGVPPAGVVVQGDASADVAVVVDPEQVDMPRKRKKSKDVTPVILQPEVMAREVALPVESQTVDVTAESNEAMEKDKGEDDQTGVGVAEDQDMGLSQPDMATGEIPEVSSPSGFGADAPQFDDVQPMQPMMDPIGEETQPEYPASDTDGGVEPKVGRETDYPTSSEAVDSPQAPTLASSDDAVDSLPSDPSLLSSLSSIRSLVSSSLPPSLTVEERAASRCPDGCGGLGTCNDVTGACTCPPWLSGEDCGSNALPACMEGVLPAGNMGCAGRMTTCECLRDCDRAGLFYTEERASTCVELHKEGVLEGVTPDSAWSTPLTDYGNLVRYHRSLVAGKPGQIISPVARDSFEGTQGLRPQSACPDGCYNRGDCVAAAEGLSQCQCSKGYGQHNCFEGPEAPPLWDCARLLNGCSGKGVCDKGFCRCNPGSWGVDCSLEAPVGDDGAAREGVPASAQSPDYDTYSAFAGTGGSGRVLRPHPGDDGVMAPPADVAPQPISPLIYVYELPPRFTSGMNYAYTLEGGSAGDGRQQSLETLFHLALLSSQHRTADPEKANFFFVPTWSQRVPQSWQTRMRYHRDVVDSIRTDHPWWDRSSGADHIFVTDDEYGTCGSRKEIAHERVVFAKAMLGNAIWIHHFGLTSDKDTPGGLWFGPCHKPGHDVVVPTPALLLAHGNDLDYASGATWASLSPLLSSGGVARSPATWPPSREWLLGLPGQGPAQARDTLLYVTGATGDGNVEKRDQVMELVENSYGKEAQVIIQREHSPEEYTARLASSRFCFAVEGSGGGSGVVDALLMGCVPVIIVGDGLQQPLEELLDYDRFSIRVHESTIPQLLDILHAVPSACYEAMQAEVQCVMTRFLWRSVHRGRGQNQGLSSATDDSSNQSLFAGPQGEGAAPGAAMAPPPLPPGPDAFASVMDVLRRRLEGRAAQPLPSGCMLDGDPWQPVRGHHLSCLMPEA